MTTENVTLKLAQLDQPLDVTELTTAEIAGTGVFDVLMQSVKNHVQEEHAKSRITGKEYATVYLEALQSTMAQSIEYLLRAKTLGFELDNLGKQGVLLDHQAEIAIKDAQLKFAQIAQTQAQTELTEQQVKSAEAEAHKIPVEISLLRSNLELAGVEKDLRIAQVSLAETEKDIAVYNLANKTPVEVELLQAQTDNAQSQIALTEAQVIKITEENKVIPYTIERMQAEIANMTRQSDILEKELEIKISSLALQDKQLLLADAELEVRKLELEVKRAEVETAQSQAQLYAAKVLTENAQTMDAAHPNSVLGSNIAVLQAQASGYARDAEQKAAKILVDAWNVQRNTDESIQANSANLLYDQSIGKAVSALLRGAGI